MRSWPLLSLALLAACAASPPPVPAHGETPGHVCNAAGTDRFLGQQATAENGAAIFRATHAAVVRWAPPGVMLTMDYREDRVTIRLGPDRRILRISCG